MCQVHAAPRLPHVAAQDWTLVAAWWGQSSAIRRRNTCLTLVVSSYLHAHIYLYIYTYLHMYIHMCISLCIHIYTYISMPSLYHISIPSLFKLHVEQTKTCYIFAGTELLRLSLRSRWSSASASSARCPTSGQRIVSGGNGSKLEPWQWMSCFAFWR